MLAICFCIIIAHAFGYPERGKTGKKDLRVNGVARKLVSRYAKQAFNQHNRLQDVRTAPQKTVAKLDEIPSSATQSIVATPLTATSTASKTTKASANVLESSPGSTLTNFSNTGRSLFGRKILNASIDPYHSSLTDAIFKKMPTRLKYAINLYAYALLKEYFNNRKETNMNEIVALFKETNHEGRKSLKQSVQETGSEAADAIDNCKAVRKGETRVNPKATRNLAPISKASSAFPTRYATLRTDRRNFHETSINVARGLKGERAKDEEVKNASTKVTENATIEQAERVAGFERSDKQKRKKRRSNSVDTQKRRDVVAQRSHGSESETAKAQDEKVREVRVARKAKTDETEIQRLLASENAKDEKAKPVGENVTNHDLNATEAKNTTSATGNILNIDFRNEKSLLLMSLAFAMVVQLIVASMILIKYRKKIMEWIAKLKKRRGEKRPLHSAKRGRH